MISALAGVMSVQTDILNQLLDALVGIKNCMKDSDLNVLQEKMSDLRRLSVSAQAAEAKRARVCEELSSSLNCKSNIAEILEKISQEDRVILEDAAKKLTLVVSHLRAENKLLAMLMEEAKDLNEMMLSEWRHMAEDSMSGPVSFDSRG